jgi:hypothetical protein
MTVQFQHPLNGFTGFDPSNENHYNNLTNVPGIYIYGLRLEFKNNNTIDRKFLPIYVGETNNLKKRLFDDHYQHLKTGGCSNKEIFNWSRVNNFIDIVDIYKDMKNYQQSHTSHNATLENLIWYNNHDFFDKKLSLNLPNGSAYKSDTGVMMSILTILI